MSKHLHIDHLVYATPDLAATVADIETRFGVAPQPGGAHVGLGTFNALLGLGDRTYLEIVGPDPAQPAPDFPRPFGVDMLEAATLVAWCAAPRRPLPEVIVAARESGFDPGDVLPMSRRRIDGVVIEWDLTLGALPENGVVPFFIDWGRTEHPTHGLQVGGTLTRLGLHHPQPRSIDMMLSAVSDDSVLGDEESMISLNYADRPAINAEILTANGPVVLA
ncbi:MAG: VOC family protein [Acidimicrobiia bacterium]